MTALAAEPKDVIARSSYAIIVSWIFPYDWNQMTGQTV